MSATQSPAYRDGWMDALASLRDLVDAGEAHCLHCAITTTAFAGMVSLLDEPDPVTTSTHVVAGGDAAEHLLRLASTGDRTDLDTIAHHLALRTPAVAGEALVLLALLVSQEMGPVTAAPTAPQSRA